MRSFREIDNYAYVFWRSVACAKRRCARGPARDERWRKGDNLAMLAVTDAFKRGFGSQRWPLVPLGNAGMNLTDRLGAGKTRD